MGLWRWAKARTHTHTHRCTGMLCMRHLCATRTEREIERKRPPERARHVPAACNTRSHLLSIKPKFYEKAPMECAKFSHTHTRKRVRYKCKSSLTISERRSLKKARGKPILCPVRNSFAYIRLKWSTPGFLSWCSICPPKKNQGIGDCGCFSIFFRREINSF